MNVKKVISVLFILVVLVAPVYALTASLGSSRAVINFELKDGGSNILERDVIVRNVNDYPIEVTLEGDGDFKGVITFPVNPVTLDADSEKPIPFKVKISQPGTLEGKINVYFRRGDGIQETPAVLRATYIVLVTGEGQEVPTQPQEPSDDNSTQEAPRTFETPDDGNGSVGLSIGGNSVGKPVNPESGGANWFLISFLAFIAILIVLGAVYILRK